MVYVTIYYIKSKFDSHLFTLSSELLLLLVLLWFKHYLSCNALIKIQYDVLMQVSNLSNIF